MSNVSIKLKRYEPVEVEIRDRHSWIMKVEAKGVGIPSEVFVYSDGPTEYHNYGDSDVFQCVASLPQMHDIPAVLDDTCSLKNHHHYRRSDATFVFADPESVEDAWRIIKEDIKALVDNWNSEQVLKMIEEVEIS